MIIVINSINMSIIIKTKKLCTQRGLAERLRSSQVNPAIVHKRVKFIVCNFKFIVVSDCIQIIIIVYFKKHACCLSENKSQLPLDKILKVCYNIT